ncbi:MAG: Verru_Chthon cassette protein A, partial [Verrucomicrobiota bacterium]
MRPRAAKRSTLANWANQEGAAIITILVLFSLMAVLVSAILIISRDERRSAGRVSESTRSRILTDLPASLVIAQIRAATEIEDTVWASQPGAIRTLENNGDPGQIYKLYSAARMLAEDRIDALDEDLDETWIDHPDVFADLNAPVARGKSNDLSLHFPILDPRATTGIGSFSDEGVEGFSYDTSVIPGAVEAVSSGLTARLPMPVAWLYVLEDGTLGTLDKSGFFNGPNEASTSNPIVARIAFWTDDESCKVNINTAVEGSFWDTPRFNTVQERAFGKFQPVFGEYSRYPGHPATTSLSAVLAPGSTLDPSRAYDMDVIQELHNTSPRIAFGGSMFGTVSQSNGYTMPPAREALFATVDELAFNPDRSLSGFDPNPLRFFLTTSSRAPEVNLFNQPRMAMWPIHADVARSSGQSAFGTPNDELIAFCATAGGYPYFYQRAFANDPIREFFESADGRNATLFNWLRRLTAKPHPGYGDSFADKYGSDFASDRDQILAQVFDYIRCTNLFDPHLADPSKQYTGPQGQEGHGQVTGLMLVPPNVNYSQTWQDSSLEYPKGIGRMLTISEAALVFMCNAEVKDGQI